MSFVMLSYNMYYPPILTFDNQNNPTHGHGETNRSLYVYTQ